MPRSNPQPFLCRLGFHRWKLIEHAQVGRTIFLISRCKRPGCLAERTESTNRLRIAKRFH